jgi:hypothetical protein
MARNSMKKVELSVSLELFKAAKLKADEENQSLPDWIIGLIQSKLQQEEAQVITSLDLGRIDSRIDQRTAYLERQIEELVRKVELLLSEHKLQPPNLQQPVKERPILSNAIARL